MNKKARTSGTRLPVDGYSAGCITWNRKNACMADQVWPDQVFKIIGYTEGTTGNAQAHTNAKAPSHTSDSPESLIAA